MNASPYSLGIDDYTLAGPASCANRQVDQAIDIVEFCDAEPEAPVDPHGITTL